MKINRIIFFPLLFWGLSGISYSQENNRVVQTINTAWNFHKGDIPSPDNISDIKDWEIVNIPHTWNVTDAFDDIPGYYRGKSWYTRRIFIPEEWKDKKIFLYFEGANQEANVFVNNSLAGNHKGGYTAFCFDITSYLTPGSNRISVQLDNKHDDDIPPLDADFTFYGGIYRDVYLIAVSPVHFDMLNHASCGVFIETPQVSDEKASVKVRMKILNETEQPKRIEISSLILDKNGDLVSRKDTESRIKAGAYLDLTQEDISVTKPMLWSPAVPYLYTIVTRIKDVQSGSILDEVVNPLGFRWFAVDPEKGFFLNGKHVKLVGANRHQDFYGLGNALPNDLHRRDFAKIKEMGANFVRLAHYPQDPEVYRACDELGLLVWTEIPVVNKVTPTEAFYNTCKTMQIEQIRQTFNHPSIIMYGYMNEIFIRHVYSSGLSDEEKKANIERTLKLARELNDLTKKEAPGRLTVMALHYDELYNSSGVADIPDIVGWNLYFGWYYGTLEDLGKFLDEQHAKYPERLLFVSEYGADTDTRNHTFDPRLWDFSVEYQEVFHTSYLKQMMERPYLLGMAAWNYADFGSAGRQNPLPYINQKGLVEYDRSPKEAYYLYQAYLVQKPMVYIASRTFTNRSGIESSLGSGKCVQPVSVYTNQSTVEMIVNGTSLGTRQVDGHVAKFEVPFVSGDNKLSVRTGSGLEDQLTVCFEMTPFHLNQPEFTDLAVNVGSHMFFIDDLTRTVWVPEQKYIKEQWGYTGGSVYNSDPNKPKGISNNLVGTNNFPLFQTMREGIETFRFDVADGSYKITLCFTEHNLKTSQEPLIYNLTDQTDNASFSERIFDIRVNGQVVMKNLDLAREFGNLRAVSFDYLVNAMNNSGIEVEFEPIKGKTLLSGIRIQRLY